jgi:hypothetical protein
MKAIYLTLLLCIFPLSGICQRAQPGPDDPAAQLARFDERIKNLEARMETDAKDVKDRLDREHQDIKSMRADVDVVKYLGGGVLFMAGVFFAEIIRRLATRVSFDKSGPPGSNGVLMLAARMAARHFSARCRPHSVASGIVRNKRVPSQETLRQRINSRCFEYPGKNRLGRSGCPGPRLSPPVIPPVIPVIPEE